jgi:proline iminopeptidase
VFRKTIVLIAGAAVLLLHVTSRAQEPGEGFVTVPGGKVWYRVVGRGDGIPLLILHGGPGSHSCRLSGLAALADERPVVFYDQLGSGRSERPEDKSLWQIERFVAELAAVRSALDLQRVHILGHSWGSTLAAEYLLTRQPAGVESVTFVGPLLSTPRWIADAERLRATLPDYVQRVLARHEQAGTTDSDEYKTASEIFYDRYLLLRKPVPYIADCDGSVFGESVYHAMWGPSEFYSTGNLRDYDRTARLGELRLPVLFLTGRYDEATPETVADFHRLVPGSEFVVLENSAHMSMLDEPEKFMSVVRSFLRKADKQ